MNYLMAKASKLYFVLFLIMFASFTAKDLKEEETIVVRESTVDLQIRVGEKIFVFGKANGNLEKVKVGMNVLTFVQVPKIEGVSSTYQNFTWKRNSNGSIQIQSNYKPGPVTLNWTIFSNGQLKMEANGYIDQTQDLIGLSFDYQVSQLKEVSWLNSKNLSGSFFLENEANDAAMDGKNILELPEFHKVKLNFEYVGVEIKSENPSIELNMGPVSKDDLMGWQSDISFLSIGKRELAKENILSAPGKDSENLKTNTDRKIGPMILWFDFH